MRESLSDAVVYKFITVKTRQAVVGAEPEEATWIGNDLVHAIARQTISGGVSSNRKLFGAVLRAGKDNEDEDGDRSLHGGDIIATKSHKRHKVFYRRVAPSQTVIYGAFMPFWWVINKAAEWEIRACSAALLPAGAG